MATLSTRITGFFKRMRNGADTATADPDYTAESLEKLATGGPDHDDDGPSSGGFLARITGSRREQTIQNLQRGYEEVVELMKTVRGHMESQSDRADRLLTLMQRLPEALEALPETNRNQARMLELINSHLDQQTHQAQRLNEVIGTLANSTEQNNQVMGVMQQQMDATRETDMKMLESYARMSDTLTGLHDSAKANVSALQTVSQHTRETDEKMEALLRRNARQMMVLTSVSWGLAAIALGLAIYTGIAVSGASIGEFFGF
ncbi:MAG: hypothetical protein GC159_09125 [Phycisphaera sp.]|nr:hypothetical protein [Phycisphaera sp.]